MQKEEIFKIVEKQNKWRSECLNLIASENITSPEHDKVYVSDFMHRYAEGLPFKRYYQGAIYIDELESKAVELAKDVFHAKYVDLRPISGAMANMAVFSALGDYGSILLSPGVLGGSHISHEKFGVAGILGLKTEHAIFDKKEYNIDTDATIKKIREVKPKIVVLGGSVILFPHPVSEFRKVCDEVGAKLIYDAAHVLGLIGGRKFQDPLKEGAEIISSSTHKTFPGPQGGIILSNSDEKTFKKIQSKIFPGLISNHHLHRIPSMMIATLEIKEFGEDYATQTIKNAKALGRAMYEYGFDVLCPDKDFTESHQILVDVRKNGGGKKVASTLEKANIILNKNILAFDDVNNSDDPSGLRIGVQEMTRYGMKESEMKYIAELMKKIVMDGKNPESVREEVIEFRKKFQKIHYCF